MAPVDISKGLDALKGEWTNGIQQPPELQEVLNVSENQCCADCGCEKARWASVNLGIFLCLECAAVHRSLGVSISRVCSTELDAWRTEWIDVCRKVGNFVASQYYEHGDTGNLRFDRQLAETAFAGDSRRLRELWIRAKYECQAFAPEGTAEPCKLVANGENPCMRLCKAS